MAVSNSVITIKIRMSCILNQLIISHASLKKAVKFSIFRITAISSPWDRNSKVEDRTSYGQQGILPGR